MTVQKIIFILYIAFIVLMSLVSIVAYLGDKKKAKNGAIRTKEKTLLSLAVFNGAFGSLIGRVIAHHKTDKIYFSIVIWFSLFVQVGATILLGVIAFGL